MADQSLNCLLCFPSWLSNQLGRVIQIIHAFVRGLMGVDTYKLELILAVLEAQGSLRHFLTAAFACPYFLVCKNITKVTSLQRVLWDKTVKKLQSRKSSLFLVTLLSV